MYATILRRPNDEAYTVNRLIDDTTADGPMTAQMTDSTQQIIITLLCATFEDVVRAKRYLQDMEQCFQVQDSTGPVQEGLNLFQGTLTGTRYLPVYTRDDGEYSVDAQI